MIQIGLAFGAGVVVTLFVIVMLVARLPLPGSLVVKRVPRGRLVRFWQRWAMKLANWLHGQIDRAAVPPDENQIN